LLNDEAAKQAVLLDIQDAKTYARVHLPGAVNVPYSQWRTAAPAKSAGNLPPVERLEALIGGAGIGNEDTVVIVSTGRSASDLAAAARVYWTFRMLGHESVSVLDGGLIAYLEATNKKGPLSSGTETRPAATFTADFQPQWLATAESLQAILQGEGELVDARTPGEFLGIYTGDKRERAGTVPGSRNLPHDWVTVDGSARLREEDALRGLYASLGVGTGGEQIHYCHSGNRAALTWFVSYAVFGNEQAKLYDASMKEWAATRDLPMEQQVKLCVEC